LRGKFVCLSFRHRPTLLASFGLHGRGPQPRRLSPLVLGTCAPTLPPPLFTGSLKAKERLSCNSAISIVLSAACSASWRHLGNDGHLKTFPHVGRELR